MKTKEINKETVEKVQKKVTDLAKKTSDSIQENSKTTLYIGVTVVALVIGFTLYKGTKKGVAKIFEGDPDIDNQVEDVGGDATNATINNQAARNYAQQLLDAMNAKKPVYGTDNDTIELVFDNLLNGDDYLKVFKAFGTKDYNGYNSPPEGVWSNLDSYEKRDLNYWLKSELSDFWEPTLYKKVKNRVESTGVFVF